MVEKKVVLVDKSGNQIGLMPKLEAHQKGILHRAFSIFLFNSKNQILLQKRSLIKYHSAGLWTNTCCSHPRDGEDIIDAGKRRLYEEMGIKTELKKEFEFTYKEVLGNGLTEHEFDHVLIGNFNGNPILNKDEVEDWKWMSLEEIEKDINENQEDYTVWFVIAFDYFYKNFKK
jgi:isopentenyl-diphosphate delta-isomerase|tara:strand:- start:383 stop:901 length:519 start_codon:yes stop_codon:yes gene_type:complete